MDLFKTWSMPRGSSRIQMLAKAKAIRKHKGYTAKVGKNPLRVLYKKK